MTDGARFKKKKKKKKWWPKFGANGPKLGPKLGFLLKFGLLVFLEIAYNDILQQSLTYSRGKCMEKYFQLKGTNSVLNLGFLPFS